VKQVVNTQTGDVVQQAEYDEFGNILLDTNPGFVPFGFAGGLYDSRTKLVKYEARDYHAGNVRWLTKDPILFRGSSLNLFAYASFDPVNLSDPDGKLVGFFNPYLALATGSIGAVSGAISALANGGRVGDILSSAGIGFVGGALGGGLGRGWGSVAAGFVPGVTGNIAGEKNLISLRPEFLAFGVL